MVLQHQLRMLARRRPRQREPLPAREARARPATTQRSVTAGDPLVLITEPGAGYAGDRVALASRAGAAQVDLPGALSRRATAH